MSRQVLTPPTRPLPKGKISYQQFLEWLDEDTWAEWVDGEVELMSPISTQHQTVGTFLIAILQFYIKQHGLGVLHYEPFQMKTGADLPGRSPDILFVRRENQHRLKTPFWTDPPTSWWKSSAQRARSATACRSSRNMSGAGCRSTG